MTKYTSNKNAPLATSHVYQGQILLCNEHTFWQRFYQDLDNAHSLVHIISPYITIKRSGNLSRYFRDLINRGVKVIIHTRHIWDHDNVHMKFHAKLAIIALKSMGVRFNFVSRIHRKVAVIDNHICWAGSLNILSWNNTPEQMNRFDCSKTANEFIRELNLTG
jgi:phosphatidylserine/phosphatidylglycerophosphate/cardiolipin synthase-like enzyme